MLIPLSASENEDVLKPRVSVERHPAPLLEADERSIRTALAIAIQAIDLEAVFERLPGDFVLPFSDVEKIGQLQAGKAGSGIQIRGGFDFHDG